MTMPGDPSSYDDREAQIREDESWSDFYHGLEIEAEMEKDRAYEEAEADYYYAQDQEN